MNLFSKFDNVLDLQIKRKLETNSLISAYSIAMDEIILKMSITSNLVHMTQKKMMMIIRDNSTYRAKQLMPLMEKLGVWVKIHRSSYMVNPSLVNRVNGTHFIALYRNYLAANGLSIELDAYCKSLKESQKNELRYDATIENVLRTEYESRVMKGVEREKKKMSKEIASLKKQVEELERIREKNEDFLKDMLLRALGLKEQYSKEELTNHLRVIK